jgi:hypothetical protein
VTSTSLTPDEGTCPDVELELDTADVLVELDGGTTLEDAVASVSRRERLSSRETAALRSDARRVARNLLELGVLELA